MSGTKRTCQTCIMTDWRMTCKAVVVVSSKLQTSKELLRGTPKVLKQVSMYCVF